MVTQQILTRTPAPLPPLTCFGLEHDGGDPECRACPHRAACVVAMGCREGKVALDRVEFRLGAGAAGRLKRDDPDAENPADVYKHCYSQVFAKRADWFKRQHGARLVAKARELRMSIRLYVYAAMLGFKETSPDRRFSVAHLLGGAAERNVEEFRRAAAAKFGVFDMTALLAMAGTEEEDAARTMVECEWLAAGWIVGHRQVHGQGAISSLYGRRELAFDPRWLATEPSYRRWLESPEKLVTEELTKHRYRVSQVQPKLWRAMRQEGLPEVLSRVLSQYRMAASDFEAVSPVSQPLAFWAALGDAILQWKCVRLGAGESVHKREVF